jgi:hypothetical protein
MQTCAIYQVSAVDIPAIVAGLVGGGATIEQIVYCEGYKAFLILYTP